MECKFLFSNYFIDTEESLRLKNVLANNTDETNGMTFCGLLILPRVYCCYYCPMLHVL